MRYLVFLIVLIFLGCGGGSKTTQTVEKGYFIDAYVTNLPYSTSSGISGYTKNGEFEYKEGDNITFKIGNLSFSTKAKPKITPVDLSATEGVYIAYILQNLDTDGDAYNSQIILPLNLDKLKIDSFNFADIEKSVKEFKNLYYANYPNLSLNEVEDILARNGIISQQTQVVENTNTSPSTIPTVVVNNQTPITVVDVFTIAPVLKATVVDANNQLAKYENGKYVFYNEVKYPIKMIVNSDTFVDVDYDGKRTANDIIPHFTTLQSFNNHINPLTNFYFLQSSSESSFVNSVKLKYLVDLTHSPLDDENLTKVLFGVYNYSLFNQPASLSDFSNDVVKVRNFINEYNVSTKYYGFYDVLTLLDKRVLKRADTLHKPTIEFLRPPALYIASNNSFDVFDIKESDGYIFTASGQDELVKLYTNLGMVGKSTPLFYAFGRKLSTDKNGCLYLADSLAGVKIFSPFMQSYLFSAYKSADGEVNLTQTNVLNASAYISRLDNKKLLAINAEDNFYLFNADKIESNCSVSSDFNESDILVNEQYYSIDSAFRKDGSYLYVSTGSGGILGYDISTLNAALISASKNQITSTVAYNLLLVDNDNELFASTDTGIDVFNVNDDNSLSFVSHYESEGSRPGYFPKMQFVDFNSSSYLIFTDGYYGVKILKYDSSFHPMLCGVKYFALPDSSKMAKVNSVYYKDGELYVGVDSLGIMKYNFEDLLFEHCRN